MDLQFRNAIWADADGESIDLEVEVGGQWFPFTARSDDSEEHGRGLFDAASGAAADFVPPSPPPEPTPEELRAAVNVARDQKVLEPKAVSLSSGKVFTVDMAGGGRQNIDSVSAVGMAKIQLGDTSMIPFSDVNNTVWDLTNLDVIEMGVQVVAQVSAIHVRARELKAATPIPSDPEAAWDDPSI